MTLQVAPGCEIHLVMGRPAQQLRVLDPSSGADASGVSTYTNFGAVVQQSGGLLTPVSAGETSGIIAFGGEQGVVRVRVHASVTQLWFANRHITMRAGASDYVPTVYAQFDDHTIADVTGHAWVTISVAGSGVVSVQPNDPFGRLHADFTAAGKHDEVVATAGNLRATVRVDVTADVFTPRPILNPIRYSGPYKTRRNMLFLGEGFANRDEFERHVIEIVEKRVFTSPAHSPYPQLRDHVNVWTAFEEPVGDPVSGVTIGPPLTDTGDPVPIIADPGQGQYSVVELTALVGYPPGPQAPADAATARQVWPAAVPGFVAANLIDQVFAYWKRQEHRHLLRPKDTAFGLIMGSRPCGPECSQPSLVLPNIPSTAAHFDLIPPEPSVDIEPDPRRVVESPQAPGFLHPNAVEAFGEWMQAYLGTLKYGTDSSSVDYDVGTVWQTGAADDGLIAILVNEALEAGTTFGVVKPTGHQRVALAWSLGNLPAITIDLTGPIADHDVALRRPPYDAIAGSFAHENSHALGLGDEYEDIYSKGQPVVHPPDVPEIEVHPNLTAATGPIKWNWPRIALASPLAQDVPIPPPGDPATKVTIQLEPTQGMKWHAARDKQLSVFLRVRAINPAHASYRPPLGPYTISSVVGDTLVIEGPSVSPLTAYTAGSVLYLPSTKGSLVHPAVAADLTAHGAFGGNAPATAVHAGGESPRGNIAGFKYPKHHEAVIGLYEGAGEFNSGAYRPAGNCKMREVSVPDTEFHWWPYPHSVDVTRHRPFCFVCKYILINEVWPGAFDLLDREYPEDC